jgi:hypothetical protein
MKGGPEFQRCKKVSTLGNKIIDAMMIRYGGPVAEDQFYIRTCGRRRPGWYRGDVCRSDLRQIEVARKVLQQLTTRTLGRKFAAFVAREARKAADEIVQKRRRKVAALAKALLRQGVLTKKDIERVMKR